MNKTWVFKLFLISLCISGIPWGLYALYKGYLYTRSHECTYTLKAIVQKSDGRHEIPNPLFAEWLDLSVDRPQNLYAFSLKQGEKKLQSLGVFKKINLSRIPPSTLFIEYELKKPVFLLGNQTNTALDKEGYAFPLKPFYTPKKCPSIITKGTLKWGEKMDITLPLLIKESFSDDLKSIDIRAVDAESLGEREIVVKWGSNLIRFSPEHLEEQIKRVLSLNVQKNIIEARINKALILREY